MSDKAVEQQGGGSQEAEERKDDNNNNRLAELEKKLEEQSKALSSLNSMNDKLTRALEDKEKEVEKSKEEGMSEAQKALKMAEDERAARLKFERELVQERNASKARDFLHTNGLPSDAMDLISTDDSEIMSSQLEKVKSMFDLQKETLAESMKKEMGAAPPKPGGGSQKKGKSQMSIGERMAFIKANGQPAYDALPD
jgi:predicted RNase H-like nuclease (RuvC/YqgF family)